MRNNLPDNGRVFVRCKEMFFCACHWIELLTVDDGWVDDYVEEVG